MIRICPNCGAQIPPGDVFCPNCLEEVQLVPDYDSISKRMQEREMEKREEERIKQEAILRAKKEEKKRKAAKKKKILTASVCIIIILAVVFVLGYRYLRGKNSDFEALYQMAKTEYQAQNYEEAYTYITEALEKDAESISALMLKAKLERVLGNETAAEEILLSVIGSKPSEQEAYRELLDLYMSQGRYESIRGLMEDCSDFGVRMAFAEYICTDPVFSIPGGEFNHEVDITLSAEEGSTIYYTTDGSAPTSSSAVYEGKIHLINGTTTIKAVAVKPSGIMSRTAEETYVVKTSGLNAPDVEPASGNYRSEEEKITVTVPVDCVCYYSFDKRAEKTDLIYTEPVDMPEGSHIFYCFIVDSHGEVSQQTIRTYVFTKLLPTPTPTPEPEPTSELEPEPTPTPTPTPTPDPTPTPTPDPTPTPTPEPTPTPTPTPEPTPTVTPEPTPEPASENPETEP